MITTKDQTFTAGPNVVTSFTVRNYARVSFKTKIFSPLLTYFFPFPHPCILDLSTSDGEDGSRKEVLTVLVLSLVKLVDVGLHGFMLGILLYCTYLSAVYCQQAQLKVISAFFVGLTCPTRNRTWPVIFTGIQSFIHTSFYSLP